MDNQTKSQFSSGYQNENFRSITAFDRLQSEQSTTLNVSSQMQVKSENYGLSKVTIAIAAFLIITIGALCIVIWYSADLTHPSEATTHNDYLGDEYVLVIQTASSAPT